MYDNYQYRFFVFFIINIITIVIINIIVADSIGFN